MTTTAATASDGLNRPAATAPASDLQPRREAALLRYTNLIKQNDHDAKASALYDHLFQVAAATLSGLTAILILWADVIPKPIQALPASLAAIAIAIKAVFRWHDNYLNGRYTAVILDSEKAKYEARSKPYGVDLSDEDAFELFASNMEAVITTEINAWRTAHAQGAGADK
jgi:hypothetical protein